MKRNFSRHSFFCVCVLIAEPKLIPTQQQSLSACVGDNIVIPSYIQVSALAEDVEVTWFRQGVSSQEVPADNGIVTDNYGYKVDNISMLDTGQYFARVIVSNQDSVLGTIVWLIVGAKPGEFSIIMLNMHYV